MLTIPLTLSPRLPLLPLPYSLFLVQWSSGHTVAWGLCSICLLSLTHSSLTSHTHLPNSIMSCSPSLCTNLTALFWPLNLIKQPIPGHSQFPLSLYFTQYLSPSDSLHSLPIYYVDWLFSYSYDRKSISAKVRLLGLLISISQVPSTVVRK